MTDRNILWEVDDYKRRVKEAQSGANMSRQQAQIDEQKRIYDSSGNKTDAEIMQSQQESFWDRSVLEKEELLKRAQEGQFVKGANPGMVLSTKPELDEEAEFSKLSQLMAKAVRNFSQVRALEGELDQASIIIAALVKTNGGRVDGNIWDQYQKSGEFVPRSVRLDHTTGDIYIRIDDGPEPSDHIHTITPKSDPLAGTMHAGRKPGTTRVHKSGIPKPPT